MEKIIQKRNVVARWPKTPGDATLPDTGSEVAVVRKVSLFVQNESRIILVGCGGSFGGEKNENVPPFPVFHLGRNECKKIDALQILRTY